ncbi:unnamed protein product [Sphagnum tenellum]
MVVFFFFHHKQNALPRKPKPCEFSQLLQQQQQEEEDDDLVTLTHFCKWVVRRRRKMISLSCKYFVVDGRERVRDRDKPKNLKSSYDIP